MRREAISPEAKEALKRETRTAFIRSFLIAMGFATPYSVIQAFTLPPQYRVPILIAMASFGIPMGLGMPLMHIHLLDRMRHRSFVVTILRQTVLYFFVIAICLSVSLFF